MVAIGKIVKAGLLAGSAFLMAGCENSESTQILHAQWFFQQRHLWASLVFIICTGFFGLWRYRKYKIAVRQQRPFRCLPLAGKMFIAGASVFLAAAIILQYVETIGQQDAVRVFGVYSSDLLLMRALLLFIVQILLGVILLFLPTMLRFNYNKFIALAFWVTTFVTIAVFYFSLPLFDLAKASGIIQPGLLSPTRPSWMEFIPFGIYGSLITFVALIVEALTVRRPLKHKFANSVVEAFE